MGLLSFFNQPKPVEPIKKTAEDALEERFDYFYTLTPTPNGEVRCRINKENTELSAEDFLTYLGKLKDQYLARAKDPDEPMPDGRRKTHFRESDPDVDRGLAEQQEQFIALAEKRIQQLRRKAA